MATQKSSKPGSKSNIGSIPRIYKQPTFHEPAVDLFVKKETTLEEGMAEVLKEEMLRAQATAAEFRTEQEQNSSNGDPDSRHLTEVFADTLSGNFQEESVQNTVESDLQTGDLSEQRNDLVVESSSTEEKSNRTALSTDEPVTADAVDKAFGRQASPPDAVRRKELLRAGISTNMSGTNPNKDDKVPPFDTFESPRYPENNNTDNLASPKIIKNGRKVKVVLWGIATILCFLLVIGVVIYFIPKPIDNHNTTDLTATASLANGRITKLEEMLAIYKIDIALSSQTATLALSKAKEADLVALEAVKEVNVLAKELKTTGSALATTTSQVVALNEELSQIKKQMAVAPAKQMRTESSVQKPKVDNLPKKPKQKAQKTEDRKTFNIHMTP